MISSFDAYLHVSSSSVLTATEQRPSQEALAACLTIIAIRARHQGRPAASSLSRAATRFPRPRTQRCYPPAHGFRAPFRRAWHLRSRDRVAPDASSDALRQFLPPRAVLTLPRQRER